MDPKACLLTARRALLDGDYDTARDRLADYAGWRMAGGFEPKAIVVMEGSSNSFNGDNLAKLLKARMRELHEL